MLLELPDELLHQVIAGIAHLPQPPEYPLGIKARFPDPAQQLPGFKRNSRQLRSLSLVNRRLRQICFPFLFEYLHINSSNWRDIHAEFNRSSFRFIVDPLNSVYSRVISFHGWNSDEADSSNLLCEFLPRLARLLRVYWNSKFYNPAQVAEAFENHATLSTVLLTSTKFLPKFVSHPLSKFIVQEFEVNCDEDASEEEQIDEDYYFPNNLRLNRLIIHHPEMLTHHRFNTRRYTGLHELTLYDAVSSISFSWFSDFVDAHPTLSHIWFYNKAYKEMPHSVVQIPPFLNPLLDKFRQPEIIEFFSIHSLKLSRDITKDSTDWIVTGIQIYAHQKAREDADDDDSEEDEAAGNGTNGNEAGSSALPKVDDTNSGLSLIDMLLLVYSSFRKVEILELYLAQYQRETPFRRLVSVLSRFRSLRIVTWNNALFHLAINPKWNPPLSFMELVFYRTCLAFRAQDMLTLCADAMAKRLPKLEAVHFYEHCYPNVLCPPEYGAVFLRGWLYVNRADRQIEGKLDILE
ncbi:hypothetical protein D9757_007441 [Collybiopsis confluens]|uniref:Uncharacterized protein n=1 Tax=Collybiopsis confluens TaxID=2823264 RepID=A0A8H5HJQ6_9AGAR|nr:hypothetical protein D9757_007441 [Collybiopsis confluens]